MKSPWTTVFGEAIDLFPTDYEKQKSYTLAVIYAQNFMVFERKDVSIKKIIVEALREGKFIKYYIPQCMRYYYDDKGEQQIIGGIGDFRYTGYDGEVYSKSGNDFVSSVYSKLVIPQTFASFGLPIHVVIPVMDNELLRPQIMHTKENHNKISQFIEELQIQLSQFIDEKLRVEVCSSIEHFGNPFIEKYVPEEKTFQIEGIQYLQSLNISKKTIEVGAEGELERNSKDNSRNEYYMSEEFAQLSEIYGLLEAYFHGLKMVKNSRENSGALVEIPHGADDIMTVLKKVNGIGSFYSKLK